MHGGKMRIRLLILMIFNLFAFSGFGAVLADQGTSPDPKAKPTEVRPSHLTRREIMEKLHLTSDQSRALRKLRASFRKDMAVLDGKLKVKQVELDNELEKPDLDQSKLDLITQEIGILYGQRIGKKVKAKLELEKNILTPQQLDQLKAIQGSEQSLGLQN